MDGDTTASIVNTVLVSSCPDRARSALVVRPYRAHLHAEPGLSARGTTARESVVEVCQIDGDREAGRRLGVAQRERYEDHRHEAHLAAELHAHAETDDPERRRKGGGHPERVRQPAARVRVGDRRRGYHPHLPGAQRDRSGRDAELDIALAVIVSGFVDVMWAVHEGDPDQQAYLYTRLLDAREPIAYSGSDVERSGVGGGVMRCPEMDVAEKSGTPQGEPRYHGFDVRVEQGPERELGRSGEGGATAAKLGAGACAAEQRAQSGEP